MSDSGQWLVDILLAPDPLEALKRKAMADGMSEAEFDAMVREQALQGGE